MENGTAVMVTWGVVDQIPDKVIVRCTLYAPSSDHDEPQYMDNQTVWTISPRETKRGVRPGLRCRCRKRAGS